MIIDGKKLAEEIKNSLREKILSFKTKSRLAIVKIGSNSVTEKFLEQKKKFARDVGIDVRIYEFGENISTNQLRKEVSKIVHIEKNSGVIVQLPLPKSINTQYILDTIPPEKDPDMLSSKSFGLFATGRSKILPPVVGAVKFILENNSIDSRHKVVVIVGAGRLVGKPIAMWFINQEATVSVLNEYTPDIKHLTFVADIIISGVGNTNIVTSDMVKEGVVAIDCGTSELQGRLVGDFDPGVAKKASLFTPTPGGVGPLTVAMLFHNLVELSKRQ